MNIPCFKFTYFFQNKGVEEDDLYPYLHNTEEIKEFDWHKEAVAKTDNSLIKVLLKLN